MKVNFSNSLIAIIAWNFKVFIIEFYNICIFISYLIYTKFKSYSSYAQYIALKIRNVLKILLLMDQIEIILNPYPNANLFHNVAIKLIPQKQRANNLLNEQADISM